MREFYERKPHAIVGKQSSNDTSIVSGSDNPIGLHCVCYVLDNGDVATRFVLSKWLEGHRGVGHGGACYTVLDEFMGRAVNDYNERQGIGHVPVFTGEVTARYVSPAPCNETLYAYARVESAEGRKRFVSGEVLREDGEVIIRTKGIYLIAPNYEDKERMAGPAELTDDDPRVFY